MNCVVIPAVLILFSVSNIFAEEPKLKFSPYGFFKLDMAYDQARTNNGNYLFWVNYLDPSKDKHSEFNMTARQTRLGVNIAYEGLNDKKVTAKLEFDFYGGGAENKNLPMMRHAYLKVDFGKYYILAGQNSDVLSPLTPSTVLYVVLWNCGNIGYRRPQFRFGNVVKNGVEVVVALLRNIPGDLDGDGNDDGEESSLPSFQGRISYINPRLNVGISGHYGVMEYSDPVDTEKSKNYNSYSLNFHFNCAFTSIFSLKAEAFTGKALNQYLGGIGQGFSAALEREVESSGGWINAVIKANKNISLNAGAGLDLPKKYDDLAFPFRNSNRMIFGNIFTKIAHNTTFAVEISHWTTGYYRGVNDEITISSARVHASFIMNF